MLNKLAQMKEVTKERGTLRAIRETFRLGLAATCQKAYIEQLEADKERLAKDHLEMARLVHEYETKLGNLERRTFLAENDRKKLEQGYVGLMKENQWMREEIFSLKREP